MKNYLSPFVFFMCFSLFSQEKQYHDPSGSPITEASYPGGTSEMTKFIVKHLEVPAGFYGTDRVSLRFTVSETGEVKDIQIRRGIEGCEACSEAAIAVLTKMPRWKPAYSHPEKKEVESYFVLPIKFERELQKE